MHTFEIDPRDNGGDNFTIDAETFAGAATAAAKRIFPGNASQNAVWAERQTGDGTKSGMFQAYAPLGSGQNGTSVGKLFHVSRA
jgi:hypothetical protein